MIGIQFLPVIFIFVFLLWLVMRLSVGYTPKASTLLLTIIFELIIFLFLIQALLSIVTLFLGLVDLPSNFITTFLVIGIIHYVYSREVLKINSTRGLTYSILTSIILIVPYLLRVFVLWMQLMGIQI